VESARGSLAAAELLAAEHDGGLGASSAVLEFGADVTRAFCAREGISLVIRAHQFVPHGYKYMHGGRLITLFSARNYFEMPGERPNDAAVLLLANDINGHLRVYPLRIPHSSQGRPAAGRARSPPTSPREKVRMSAVLPTAEELKARDEELRKREGDGCCVLA